MSTYTIRTIIVDDEPAARHGMAIMLVRDREIEIVASCSNGIEAIQEIREKNPDLVLLDIQMPGIDGFDVLNNIPKKERPYIVFVTAYDQFAVKAFEYHALDYLLKPYTDERFFEMIGRIKNLITQKKAVKQMQNLDQLSQKLLEKRKHLSDVIFLQDNDISKPEQNKLIVREGGRIHLIPLEKIHYIEAYDYYLKIHLTDSFILVRMPLKNMEKELSESVFIRIHRSYILNLLFLEKIEKNDTGDYQVVLTNGKTLKVSNTYKNDLLKRIKSI